MYIGKISYTIFRYVGMWRPSTWDSRWRIWIYRVYSTFIIINYSIFLFGMLIYLLQNTGDMETLFYISAIVPSLFKMTSIMVRRNTLIDLKNMFAHKLCQPRDVSELEILRKSSKVCRMNTIIFLLMTIMCALPIILIPPSMRSNFPLPFKVWIPYSLDNRFVYCMTYFHQGVTIMVSAFVTAAVESLASVIMLQICAQLEIIVHRLHSLPRLRKQNDSDYIIYQRESRLVSDCVNHHNSMYLLGEKLNVLFGSIISVQFVSSTIGLGTVIYYLSKLSLNNAESMRLIIVLVTALLQIFIYSFYGQKIMEKSMAIAEEVYQIDWVDTTIKSKKNLDLIMVRAGKPMLLTDSYFIVMRIDTFVKIVKSAYSAYNLLRNT